MTIARTRLMQTLWAATAALPFVAGAAASNDGTELRALYESRKDGLAHSPFKRPLLLDANATGDPHGDVYAVIDHPFAKVGAALKGPVHWCEVFLLQTNVRRCVPSGSPVGSELTVSITRRFDQTLEDAYEVSFRFEGVAATDNYLAVNLRAAKGPFGTNNYKLVVESVPIDDKHSFLHMSYAYSAGMAARMATDAYLASAGRSKVGFTVTGKDDSGEPRYVGGMQGVSERNTLRYFLAIESLLKSLNAPKDQQDEIRTKDFYTAIERYPLQLHEMSREEYQAMKVKDMAAR